MANVTVARVLQSYGLGASSNDAHVKRTIRASGRNILRIVVSLSVE